MGKIGYLPEIYSIGHRNPLGLTIDPNTGEIWSTEFGPRGGDELNRIQAGKNYGWMDVTNGTHYDGTLGRLGKNNVAGFRRPRRFLGARVRGTMFVQPRQRCGVLRRQIPAWKGNLLVGSMGSW